MSELVERLARAILRARAPNRGRREWAMAAARLALKELREPSRQMLDAAQRAAAIADARRAGFGIADAHRAMIDFALTEDT